MGDEAIGQMTALAYLHDAGKLAPGFQAKGWPGALWKGPTDSHLEAGWTWFAEKATEGGPVRDLLRLSGEPWVQALLAHYGRPTHPPAGVGRAWPILPEYDWRAGERQLLEGQGNWFPRTDAFLPDAPRLHHLFAGLLALADWIGSDRRWFGFVASFDPAYGALARARAAQALADIGFDPAGWRPEDAPGFSDLTGYATPNPAQAGAGGLPVEHRLVILEAETGSGKTEAALWRFARLLAKGRVDGLYFALPTRAAAAQIQRRISEALTRWLGSASPGVLLAVPGQIRVDGHEGYRLPGWDVRWDDDPGGRRWAAEHATRFLAAPVAVGTVDQAMIAALSVKHAPMRGASVARSLLVVDEVHASDGYMRRILQQLLDDHLALGGHAMLMSATLGRPNRR